MRGSIQAASSEHRVVPPVCQALYKLASIENSPRPLGGNRARRFRARAVGRSSDPGAQRRRPGRAYVIGGAVRRPVARDRRTTRRQDRPRLIDGLGEATHQLHGGGVGGGRRSAVGGRPWVVVQCELHHVGDLVAEHPSQQGQAAVAVGRDSAVMRLLSVGVRHRQVPTDDNTSPCSTRWSGPGASRPAIAAPALAVAQERRARDGGGRRGGPDRTQWLTSGPALPAAPIAHRGRERPGASAPGKVLVPVRPRRHSRHRPCARNQPPLSCAYR